MFHCLVLFAVDDETDREDIEDSFERDLLLLHLLVYGQCCLCADLQLVADTFFREFLLEWLDELGHKLLSVSLRALELVCDSPVLLWFSITEVDVLEFALYIVESQLVGERYVQHHGLENLPFA